MGNWAKTLALSIVILLFFPTIAITNGDDSWETKPSITQPGIVGGTVVADGKIFLLGSDGKSLYAYDPSDGKCIQKADLQIPYENPRSRDTCVLSMTAIQNEIYVIAGINYFEYKTFSVVKIYNTTENTWRDGQAPPHTILNRPIGGAIDGKIYLIDGDTGFNEVFNPSSNSWAVKNPIPFWYVFFGQTQQPVELCAVLGDTIYCFTQPWHSPTKTLIYDTKTDSWTLGVELPLGNNTFIGAINMESVFIDSTSGVYAPQRIYLMGVFYDYHGEGKNSKLSYIYDPDNESWYTESSWNAEKVQTDISSDYFDYHGVVLNDKIYFIGYNNDSSGYEVKVYTPRGYSTTPLPYAPTHNQSGSPLPRLEIVEFVVGAFLITVLAVCVLLFKRHWKTANLKQ
jgi:outer membrane protein assembly factor BamB